MARTKASPSAISDRIRPRMKQEEERCVAYYERTNAKPDGSFFTAAFYRGFEAGRRFERNAKREG